MELEPSQQVGWSLWLQWTLATALGFSLGLGVAAIVIVALGSFGGFLGVAFAALLVVGTAQWLILRRQISDASWWRWVLPIFVGLAMGVVASSIMAVALNLNEIMDFEEARLVVRVLSSGLGGILIGTIQWHVLKQRASRSTQWQWVLANALGWAVGLTVGRVMDIAPTEVEIAVGMVALRGAGVGAIIGMITGIALVRVLQHSSSGDE